MSNNSSAELLKILEDEMIINQPGERNVKKLVTKSKKLKRSTRRTLTRREKDIMVISWVIWLPSR